MTFAKKPEDPITAARGALKLRISSSESRKIARRDEEAAERRRQRSRSREG